MVYSLLALPCVSAAFLSSTSGAAPAGVRAPAAAMGLSSLSQGRGAYAWDAARGLYMAPEPNEPKPEIDPRRKDPASPPSRPFVPLPTVGAGDDKMDVMSRLLKDRILMLGQQVDDEIANVLVAQLLYLANEDAEKDITMYINSPGGSVSAGMAIFDTMQFIPCDTNTVCFGTAASMGAFLLGAGTRGKRRSLPNSRIMIHQPLGGAQGQARLHSPSPTPPAPTREGPPNRLRTSRSKRRRSSSSARCSASTSRTTRVSPSRRSRRTATATSS